MNKWEFSALPQGDELRKDGRLVVSYREAEAILNTHDRLVDALDNAVKDLVAYQVNARMALKSDGRWDGVSELVQPTIDSGQAALSKARGEES